MGEQGFGDGFASAAQMIDGAFEIQGVPVGDRGDDEVQPRGPMGLVLQGSVREATLAMGIDGLRQGVAGLALVQSGLAHPTLRRMFQPVEREQRALDAPDLAEREVQAVLTLSFSGGRPASTTDRREDELDHVSSHPQRCILHRSTFLDQPLDTMW